eukprot:1513428-Amphidinium_carterae.1
MPRYRLSVAESRLCHPHVHVPRQEEVRLMRIGWRAFADPCCETLLFPGFTARVIKMPRART